eukprot:gene238-434_t
MKKVVCHVVACVLPACFLFGCVPFAGDAGAGHEDTSEQMNNIDVPAPRPPVLAEMSSSVEQSARSLPEWASSSLSESAGGDNNHIAVGTPVIVSDHNTGMHSKYCISLSPKTEQDRQAMHDAFQVHNEDLSNPMPLFTKKTLGYNPHTNVATYIKFNNEVEGTDLDDDEYWVACYSAGTMKDQGGSTQPKFFPAYYLVKRDMIQTRSTKMTAATSTLQKCGLFPIWQSCDREEGNAENTEACRNVLACKKKLSESNWNSTLAAMQGMRHSSDSLSHQVSLMRSLDYGILTMRMAQNSAQRPTGDGQVSASHMCSQSMAEAASSHDKTMDSLDQTSQALGPSVQAVEQAQQDAAAAHKTASTNLEGVIQTPQEAINSMETSGSHFRQAQEYVTNTLTPLCHSQPDSQPTNHDDLILWRFCRATVVDNHSPTLSLFDCVRHAFSGHWVEDCRSHAVQLH